MEIEESEKRIEKDFNTQRNFASVEREEKNEIGSCTGGLSEEQQRKIQEELDRAKEDNSNFSSSSRCVICW